jgi:hypothetical protein
MKLNDAKVSVTGARVFVCALVSARLSEPESVLDAIVGELERNGAIVVGRLLQRTGVSRSRRAGGAAKMDKPLTQRGLFGTGKLEELARLTKTSRAELLVIHNVISDGQRKLLAELTGCEVYTMHVVDA